MILGFTGSQIIPPGSAGHLIDSLHLVHDKYSPETVVLGACIGYDEAIQAWYMHNRPGTRRIVVVPANRSRIGLSCLHDSGATFITMSAGSDYRSRNEKLVELCDQLAGFWTGLRVRSGTFMTLNIARKVGKLDVTDIFGVPPITDEEARYLYTHGDV